MRTVSCVAAVLCAASLAAQQPPSVNPFASRVVAHDDHGGAGGGIFLPQNALGRPDGATRVDSLGLGGSLTLGFDVTIVDGPGADLLVAENPFANGGAPWATFAETCFVEVSSDGVTFARLPSRYSGPQIDPGAFAFVHSGWYSGLAGVLPVNIGATDAQDVVLAGGDAFDLADLRNDPLVVGGQVDLNAIREVRLVDAVTGVDLDARGAPIRDPGAGSADIDAVTVIQHASNQSPHAPRVALDVPANGDFTVTISDPDGIQDLDPASWHVALFGLQLSPTDLVLATTLTQATPTSFTLRLGAPLPPGFPFQLSVSIQDHAGHHSGASRARPL